MIKMLIQFRLLVSSEPHYQAEFLCFRNGLVKSSRRLNYSNFPLLSKHDLLIEKICERG